MGKRQRNTQIALVLPLRADNFVCKIGKRFDNRFRLLAVEQDILPPHTDPVFALSHRSLEIGGIRQGRIPDQNQRFIRTPLPYGIVVDRQFYAVVGFDPRAQGFHCQRNIG